MVLIQRSRAARVGLPVQVRNILVEPLDRPVIDDISPATATAGTALTIRGRNFVDRQTSAHLEFDWLKKVRATRSATGNN